MNDSANLTLALGASPIMSSCAEEMSSLSLFIGSLLLNLGTLSDAQVHAQKLAGKAAKEGGKPVVFDPVGVGATPYRRAAASGTLRFSRRVSSAWSKVLMQGVLPPQDC